MKTAKSSSKKPKSSVKKSHKKADNDEDGQNEFSLPGQKYDPPPMGDGTRNFYESLLQQRPDSLMAQEWCLKYGVLPLQKAEEIYKKLEKRK